MRDLTVDTIHTYYVIAGNTPVLVHNEDGGGTSGTIFRSGNTVFQIYANDHGPPHGHLKGPGYDIQIGQNGKPIDPDVQLTSAQQKIVDENLGTIRSSIGAKMAEYRMGRCG